VVWGAESGGGGVIQGGVANESNQMGSELRGVRRGLVRLLVLLSVVVYGLGFLHLRADFPTVSPGMDWSKMADEGWYGGAAIHYFVQGRWYLADLVNPVVAMPVWPAMLGFWFAMTGVSMLAARALTMVLYGVSLVLLYRVVWQARPGRLAAVVVLLTVVDPLSYAFNRLAILEPVMLLWFVLALWLAGETEPEEWPKQVLLGVVILLLVLTQPAGAVLVPAVLYLMGARWGWRDAWRRGVAAFAIVVGTAVVLGEGYLQLLVRPQYVTDYALMTSLHAQRVHLAMLPTIAWELVQDGGWISPVLFSLLGVVLLLSVVWLRELWRVPLFGAAVIAIAGQMAYIGYYGDLQPRYFAVLAMPVMIVVGLGVAAVVAPCADGERPGRGRLTARVLVLLVVAAGVGMAVETAGYVLHPEYSYWEAAQGVAAIIDADGGSKPMLLSDSGDDLTLWTGLPAVSANRTTHGMGAVLERYRPGWYAAWAGEQGAEIEQVGSRYRMDAVARYRVFGDPARQTLVLYKLTPR
jgi:hypothetical protein